MEKTDSRGVMILTGSGLEFSQLKKRTDESGRYITLLCEIQGCKYLLVNSNTPNTGTENEHIHKYKFFQIRIRGKNNLGWRL